MTRYDFKAIPEAIRAFGITAIVFVGAQITQIAAEGTSDWENALFSLGVGAFAAGIAAAVAALTRNQPL